MATLAPVTDRQALAWETVDRLRSTRLAASELGISVSSLCGLVKLYCERSGAAYPRGMVARPRKNGAPEPLRLSERLDVIEESLADILTGEKARDETLAAILREVSELNARQPFLLVERYATHRRQADGGEGGKVERGGRRR